MTKIIEKKQIVLMYIFASAVYFMSYFTRINYNTVLVEISTAENILHSLLALPLTASFITYGLGQTISGWLGDKVDPFRLISLGLGLSALMNILLPIFPKLYVMTMLWAVNGFAQALIYPPLMKLTSHYLSEGNYAKTCLFVTIGSHAATLLMYIISPVIITIASWKFVFFSSFGCAAVFLVIWQIYAGHIKKKYGKPFKELKTKGETVETAEMVSPKTLLISSGLIIIMIAVVMMGFLRDGIATWMPAYLLDVFSLSNEISILTTVILPIFNIFSIYVILAVRNKLCRNELKLAGITFLTSVAAIALLQIFRANMPLSVLFLALTSACSHAVNFLLICLVPKRFEQYGRFSFVTGLINSCTYIGSTISTYGSAAVAESCGWNMTLALWGVIALIGFVCCFAAKRKC